MTAPVTFRARRVPPQSAEQALSLLFAIASEARQLLRAGDGHAAYIVALRLVVWTPPSEVAPAQLIRLERQRLAIIRELSDLEPEIAGAAARHATVDPFPPLGA